jgi:protein-S-isoprenylcysteine O-methyltransferase Ste14
MFRSVLAITLWSLFALVAFGWRTYVQVRRHGDAGWRMRPGGGPVAVVAHVSFVVALVLSVAAPVAALAEGEAHMPRGVAVLSGGAAGGIAAVLGGLSMALGSLLAVRAQVDMGASWRIGVDDSERTELVTTGAFAHMRNPIFSGMLLALTGLGLLVPNALAVVALTAGVVGLQLQVRRVEEPYLVAAHGSSYLEWAARTGRFVPGVGLLQPPADRPFRDASHAAHGG